MDATIQEILHQVTNSKIVKETTKSIIVSRVKIRRKIEKTFKVKMDCNFKGKGEDSIKVMNRMMAGIEERVGKLIKSIDTQITTPDKRQMKLVDPNNTLYSDINDLKLIVTQLESKVETNSAKY